MSPQTPDSAAKGEPSAPPSPARFTDAATPLQVLKEEVIAFSEARDWSRFHAPRELALALSVEAGALLELFLWTDDRIPGSRPQPTGDALEDELADVAICLLNLCARTQVDLASAIARKLQKNAQKYPAAQVRGSAKRYHEYDPLEIQAGGANDAAREQTEPRPGSSAGHTRSQEGTP